MRQCLILENEIDGSVLLKLSESMVARLFPTIKLEVQFLELLHLLKQRHSMELNSKKLLPPPSLITGRSADSRSSRTSPFDNGNDRSSNSNSPTNNTHPQTKILKREPKHFLNQSVTLRKLPFTPFSLALLDCRQTVIYRRIPMKIKPNIFSLMYTNSHNLLKLFV